MTDDELMSKHECLIIPHLKKLRGPKFVLALNRIETPI
jgi:hypothetical protein